ncbi:MAG: diaminopimelate epimerase [Erysipelotrichaceae bacterium]|nr:diaminopimelate epimerase [Erysipelotrichaceae bacterium]MDD3809969.1 diaminopimelate epimerase [Erysipelotrichaceae bacterium]
MQIKFTKMEGIGNDYIYIDGINQDFQINENIIKKISKRHFGIGSDGVIIIRPSSDCDFLMEMYNADGSMGKMCGNGIRCFAKFCYDHKLTDKTHLVIETGAGIREVDLILDDGIVIGARVDMQKPILTCSKIPVVCQEEEMIDEHVKIGDNVYGLTAISMGNPHVVTFVGSLDFDLEKVGPEFENHPMFPESVNAEFVQIVSRSKLKMRVWERGSHETLACGTGACAVMYAAYLNGYVDEVVDVELLGGTLKIEYDKQTGHIFMTGDATTVFEGTVEF